MTASGKDELVNKIRENIELKERDPYGTLDRLEFLVDTRATEPAFFDLKEPIALKNSWRKKTGHYLVMGVASCAMIFAMIKYHYFDNWLHWMALILMIGGGVYYFRDFFENKVILEISSAGLTLDESISRKWEEIEFLYYKTKYSDEGPSDGTYLVMRLKIEYEFEVKVSDLTWSKEELGQLLYRCMKRYGK